MSDDLRRCGTCDGLGRVRDANGFIWACPHCSGFGAVKREAAPASAQITPRHMFAATAMHAIMLTTNVGSMSEREIALCAARQADAMIEALKKGEA